MIRNTGTSTKPTNDRFCALVGSISICFFALSANAQEVISMNKAISLSLEQHPDLRVYAHKSKAALALVEQAKVGRPMTFNAVAEDALGTGSYSGAKGIQTTLSISWLLEKDIIASRVKLANTQAATASVEREVKAMDVASETARVFITILSQIEKLKLAKLAEQQAQEVLKQITVKVQAGKLFAIDELRAKAALSLFTLEVEDLTHEIEASKAQLAAQWRGSADFEVSGDLSKIPSIKNLDTALAKLASTPKLKRFLIEQKIMQSEIDLAKKEQNPAWEVSAGVRRNEVVDDYAFTAGISIPLGGDNRNQGLISSLQAKQNQSRAESDALYQRISTEALLLSHKLRHNRHVIDSLSNQSIPLLEDASEKAQRAYELGSYRYTDLYAVQQELVNAQSQLIEAYTNIQLFNIELERLTGTSVSR